MKDNNFTQKHKLSGTVTANERGFAFITPEGGGEDFFVPKHGVNGAYHGDVVEFAHVKGTEDEAVILSVTARNPKPVVGTLVVDRRLAVVYPDDLRRPAVHIPRGLLNGGRNGQKVVCVITAYPKGRAPLGKVEEILGDEGSLIPEEDSIIRAYGLKEEFPEEALKEARRLDTAVFAEGRVDLRGRRVITIDGEDTRDMDDGVDLTFKEDKFVLGVHIADVSRYVKYNSALDREAYERGTSVYFPDRVLPMLPKELSNGICSLNEGEDRYALTCEMTFDDTGRRLNYEIYESIINSRHKTTYSEIAALCENEPNAVEKYADILTDVALMRKLYQLLKNRRAEEGCVDLDVKEAHIYLDESGEITIPAAERTVAHGMIEQFMIAANEAVADFMQRRKLPCLYRIHEPPAPEKVKEFFEFLRGLGVDTPGDCEDIKPHDFSRILAAVKDKPCFDVVNKVMLRSMQKARYCGDNKGHFGLASNCYCHFTSPIRRYPDLFVHRVIKCALRGKYEYAKDTYGGILKSAGIDTSERERVAESAERDVDDLYKLAYMSQKIGEEFYGVISGVTAHALFCQLDNTIEGMILFEDLPHDKYEFIPEKLALRGTRRTFKIGDSVKIKIAACDLGRMKVIMDLIE